MMKRFIRCILLTLIILLALPAKALAQEMDSIQASILTCSPGTEVYEVYGHTALRMRNYTRRYDYVFNYGVFSFEQPHFVLNFVLGKCDYSVEYFPLPFFLDEYDRRGSSVTEQVLNLTPKEANLLMALLVENMKPENRTYRYNFLKCNCTTRVRDIVEAVLDGKVSYPQLNNDDTYRTILHRYTEGYDWYAEGNDILLGASVDTIVTDREAMFAPENYMAYVDQAVIAGADGQVRPMVSQTNLLVEAGQQQKPEPFPLSPRALGGLFVALMAGLLLLEMKLKRVMWGVDILLMTAQGVAGVLIAFMFFFSEHPGVGSNWQIWVLNPLPLLCMPWVIKRAKKHVRCHYHIANMVILCAFMLFYPLMPQQFAIISLPLCVGLVTRPVSYLLSYRRKAQND